MTNNAAPALLTQKEVMAKLRISRDQIKRWRRSGQFPAPIYIGTNSPRFVVDEINEWLQAKIHERANQQLQREV